MDINVCPWCGEDVAMEELEGHVQEQCEAAREELGLS